MQNLIPDVGQLELAKVPVEGWIIYSDEHSLLDSLVMLYTSLPKMEKLSTKHFLSDLIKSYLIWHGESLCLIKSILLKQ